MRGLVELGSITATEFVSAMRRYGDVHVRPVALEQVRVEVYRAARSVSTLPRNASAGRYQPFKVAIEPVTNGTRNPLPTIDEAIEPQPMLV